jgi:hypothetical protein
MQNDLVSSICDKKYDVAERILGRGKFTCCGVGIARLDVPWDDDVIAQRQVIEAHGLAFRRRSA